MTNAPLRPRPNALWRGAVGSVVLIVASMASASAQYAGWLIPAGGKNEKSPMSSVADAATKGKALFLANCARCHGPEGKGNARPGEYSADLTDDLRTELNTEGVLFYPESPSSTAALVAAGTASADVAQFGFRGISFKSHRPLMVW
jgi:mono/diheme cytochrome c family protein